MTPDQLQELLDDEQVGRLRPGRMQLSLADYLDDDDDRLRGGLL